MPVTTNTRKLAALLGASGGGIATDGTLTSTAIGDVIVAGDIADNAIDSEHYVDGSIDTAHIAASAIVTAGLADNAVTNIKLADEGTLTQSAIKRSLHKSLIFGK